MYGYFIIAWETLLGKRARLQRSSHSKVNMKKSFETKINKSEFETVQRRFQVLEGKLAQDIKDIDPLHIARKTLFVTKRIIKIHLLV